MNATLTTAELAPLLGASTWMLYELAKAGEGVELPDGRVVRALRVGRSVRWPAAPILDALGLNQCSTGRATTPLPGETQPALDAHSSA
ncbi:MAG: hypothetical protein AAGA93_20795 [Actinomycetota bacterium]